MIETRMRDLREDKDLKQKDIAKKLNMPAHTYGNYELGIRTVPLEVLVELAEYYDTSIDYILKVTDEKRPYPKSKNI